jgi:RNA polymerase sigma-70 factor (ECF subfamily)
MPDRALEIRHTRVGVMNDPASRRTPTDSDEVIDPSHADRNTDGKSGARRLTPIQGVPMASPAFAAIDLPVSAPIDDAVPTYVRRAMTGDTRAFGELYRLHRRDVARLAGRMLGPRGDLEDLIQEVFIQVFRSLPNFRGDSRFTTWLHRVTVNVALMHLRALRSRPQLGPEAPADATPAVDTESPLDGVARNERLRALYRILDQLSDKKRTVFVLHDLEGLPAGDIAKLVGSPVLTVRTRLFYARREVYAAMATDPTLDALGREMQETTASGATR